MSGGFRFDPMSQCSYIVLDQRKAMSPLALEIRNKFQIWWENYWNEILKSVNIDEKIDLDEFLGQHKITALLFRDQVVSMHLLSIYNKSDFRSHPYFKKFDSSFIAHLENLNIHKILTLQYLAFDAQFGKEKPFIYFPMTIGSLSVRHQYLEGAQATISVARKDLGITNALTKMNFTSLQEDGIYNNTPVSFQIALDPKPHPSAIVNELLSRFWENQNELNLNDKEVVI